MQGQLHGCRKVGRRGWGRAAVAQRDDGDEVESTPARYRSATGQGKTREEESGLGRRQKRGQREWARDAKTEKGNGPRARNG
jgi:hypothetical protein